MRATRLAWTATATALGCLGCLGCFGCSGDGSDLDGNPVSPQIVTPDAAPPAPPAWLAAAAGPGVVKLDWEPNTADEDFLAYNVYRLVEDRRYLLNRTPLGEDGYIDRHPWRGACAYAVTAVDLAGNESALAVILYDPNPPVPQQEQR